MVNSSNTKFSTYNSYLHIFDVECLLFYFRLVDLRCFILYIIMFNGLGSLFSNSISYSLECGINMLLIQFSCKKHLNSTPQTMT